MIRMSGFEAGKMQSAMERILMISVIAAMMLSTGIDARGKCTEFSYV